MVELTSYGLTALTAVLVIAFCLACSDELPSTREKSSHDLVIDAHLDDSRMGGITKGNLRLGRSVRERQETALAYLLRKTSPVETVRDAIRNDRVQNDRGSRKAFNG